jgi:hypothetical protein
MLLRAFSVCEPTTEGAMAGDESVRCSAQPRREVGPRGTEIDAWRCVSQVTLAAYFTSSVIARRQPPPTSHGLPIRELIAVPSHVTFLRRIWNGLLRFPTVVALGQLD